MKKKLKLKNIEVKSFVTDQPEFDSETVKGGTRTIAVITNDGPRCLILNTINCPTRNINICNLVTQNITCNQNSILNCPVTFNICIVPTVVGPLC